MQQSERNSVINKEEIKPDNKSTQCEMQGKAPRNASDKCVHDTLESNEACNRDDCVSYCDLLLLMVEH